MADFLPVYTQACKDASPVGSGVLLLPVSGVLMPAGIVGGIYVAKSGKYRPPLWVAWVFLMVGAGILSILTAEVTVRRVAGLEIIASIGMGLVLVCAIFPILAPIPVELNPQALSFFMFIRFFAQVSTHLSM